MGRMFKNQITTHITEEQAKRFERVLKKEKLPKSTLVRLLFVKGLKQLEKEWGVKINAKVENDPNEE